MVSHIKVCIRAKWPISSCLCRQRSIRFLYCSPRKFSCRQETQLPSHCYFWSFKFAGQLSHAMKETLKIYILTFKRSGAGENTSSLLHSRPRPLRYLEVHFMDFAILKTVRDLSLSGTLYIK